MQLHRVNTVVVTANRGNTVKLCRLIRGKCNNLDGKYLLTNRLLLWASSCALDEFTLFILPRASGIIAC